jgi:hypothetical protein
VNFVEKILTSEAGKSLNTGSNEEFGLVLLVLFFTGFRLTKTNFLTWKTAAAEQMKSPSVPLLRTTAPFLQK